MPSHPSSQISTDHKTEPDEPDHSSIDPSEKASSDAENNDDEKSTKPLPDGGRDAWLNVLGTHLIYISTWGVYLPYCTFSNHTPKSQNLTLLPSLPFPSLPLADNNDNIGLITAYGAYAHYYTNSLLPNSTATEIAWPGTLQAVLIIAVGVISGPFFDRGYIRTLLFIGSFFVVCGMMMLSLAERYYQVCRNVFFFLFLRLVVAIMCGSHANGGGRLCSHKECAWGSGAEWYMCHRWRWCRFLLSSTGH